MKQTVTTDMPIPPIQVDMIGEATKLNGLKMEYQTLSERMDKIRAEVIATYAILNSAVPSELTETPQARRRSGVPKHVANPRPVEHKISIAAGKAVTDAKRRGKSFEQCTEAGIDAAIKVAKRNGVSKVSKKVLIAIRNKVKLRFNVA